MLILLAMAATLPACKREQPGEEAVRPRSVKVVTLDDPGLERVIEFPGQIQAILRSRKAFEVSGRITKMHVKEADSIRFGQVLAELDGSDFKAEVASAEARFDAAEAVERRLMPLVEKKAVSLQELELAKRDRRTARAALDRAEKALRDTQLIADFDGKVAKVLVEDYANVVAKQDVMIIQDDSSMEITVHVPESVLAIPIPGETNADKVAAARPVVVPSALPELEIPAEYHESSETPDPTTRTYELTLKFTPPEGTLVHAGMTAKVRATIPAMPDADNPGYAVPMSAVFSGSDDVARIWRVDPALKTVNAVEVETGAQARGMILVSGDLGSGDVIAVSGVHRLRDDQPVRIWDQP